MICYWDESNHPFKGTPTPLAERVGRQMAQDSENMFNIAIAGVDMENWRFEVDLGRSTPQKFVQWANQYAIVRCDINRGSDFLIFLGRSPVTMQVVEDWQAGAIPGDMLSALTPDEVFGAMQNIAERSLQGSNERVDALRVAARTNPIAQEHLEALEHNAVLELRKAGFKMPDQHDDPLGPSAQPQLSDMQRQALADEWGSLSGWDTEEPANNPTPQSWDGF